MCIKYCLIYFWTIVASAYIFYLILFYLDTRSIIFLSLVNKTTLV